MDRPNKGVPRCLQELADDRRRSVLGAQERAERSSVEDLLRGEIGQMYLLLQPLFPLTPFIADHVTKLRRFVSSADLAYYRRFLAVAEDYSANFVEFEKDKF